MNDGRWAYVPAGHIGGPPIAPPPPDLVAQYVKQRGIGMPRVTTPTQDMERQARPITGQSQQVTTPPFESSAQNASFQHLPSRCTLSLECAKMDDASLIDSRQRDADFVPEQSRGAVVHLAKPETLVCARRRKPRDLRSNQLYDCQNEPGHLGPGGQFEAAAVHYENHLNDNVSFRSDASDGTAIHSLESDETLIVGSLDDDDASQGQRPSVLPKISKIRASQRNEEHVESIETETAMMHSSMEVTTPKNAQAFGHNTVEVEHIRTKAISYLSARTSRAEGEGQQDTRSTQEVGDSTLRRLLLQRCAGDNADNHTRSLASDTKHSNQRGSPNDSTRGDCRDDEKYHACFDAVNRNQHEKLADSIVPKARVTIGRTAAAPHAELRYYRPDSDRGPANAHSIAKLRSPPFKSDVNDDASGHSQSPPSPSETKERQHISLSDIIGLEQADYSESSRRLGLHECRCPHHADCIDKDNYNRTSTDLHSRCNADEMVDTALEAHDFGLTRSQLSADGRPREQRAARDNPEASVDIGNNSTHTSQTFNQNERQQPGQHAGAPGYRKNWIVHKQSVGTESPELSTREPTSCKFLRGTKREPAACLGPVTRVRYDVPSHGNAPSAILNSDFSSSGACSSEKACDVRPVVDEELVVSSQSFACHDDIPKNYKAKAECPPDCRKLTLSQAAAIALSRATLRTEHPTQETQIEEDDDNRGDDSGESASFSSPLRESSSSNASQDTSVTKRPNVDDLGAKTRAMIQSYAHLRRAVRDSKETRDVYMATCLDKDAAFRRIFFDLIDHEAASPAKNSTGAPSYETKARGVDGAVLLKKSEDALATPRDGQVGSTKGDQRAHTAMLAQEETWQKDKSITSRLNVVQSPSCDRLNKLRKVLVDELQGNAGSVPSERKLETALSELGRIIPGMKTRGNQRLCDTQQQLPDNILARDKYAAHSMKQRKQRRGDNALQQRRSDDFVAIQEEGAAIRKHSKLGSLARAVQCVNFDACSQVPAQQCEFSDLQNPALNEVCGALSIVSTDGVWRRRHFRLNMIQRLLESGRVRIDLARICRVDAPLDVRTFDLVCVDPPGFYKLRAPSVSDRATWLNLIQPSLVSNTEKSSFDVSCLSNTIWCRSPAYGTKPKAMA